MINEHRPSRLLVYLVFFSICITFSSTGFMKYLRKDTSLTEFSTSKEYIKERDKKIYFLDYRGKVFNISDVYFDEKVFSAKRVPEADAVKPVAQRHPERERVSEGKNTAGIIHQVYIHVKPNVQLDLNSNEIDIHRDSIENVTMIEKKGDSIASLGIAASIVITTIFVIIMDGGL